MGDRGTSDDRKPAGDWKARPKSFSSPRDKPPAKRKKF